MKNRNAAKGVIMAACGVILMGCAAPRNPPPGEPVVLITRREEALPLESEFNTLLYSIETFRRNHGVYPRTLAEAWECPFAPRDRRRPDFDQWIYSSDARTNQFALRHKRYGALRSLEGLAASAQGARIGADGLLRVEKCDIFTSSPQDIERLTQALRSGSSPGNRADAVWEAERVCQGDQRLWLLREALLDPEENVWTCASRALARHDVAKTTGSLAQWADSQDRTERLRAARALYAVEAEQRMALLGRLLADPDRDVRVAAATSLASNLGKDVSCSEEIRMRLLEGLRSEDASFRFASACAAGRFGLSEAVPVLMESVSAGNTGWRAYESLYSLGELKSLEATQALRTLRGHKEPGIRELAAFRLASREYPEHDADLMALADDPAAKVRMAFAERANTSKNASQSAFIARLIGLLKDRDAEVRLVAAQALGGSSCCSCPWHVDASRFGRLKDPRAAQALAHSLRDKDDRVRVAAAMSLCAYQNPDTAAALIDSLTDTARWRQFNTVGAYAAWTLREMKADVPAEKLANALLLCDDVSWHGLRPVVLDRSQKDAIRSLVEAAVPARLASRDEREVLGALRALQLFRLTGNEAQVKVLTHHPCAGIRAAAAEVLKAP